MKLIYTLLLIVLFCISENAVAQRLRNNFGAGIEIVNVHGRGFKLLVHADLQ